MIRRSIGPSTAQAPELLTNASRARALLTAALLTLLAAGAAEAQGEHAAHDSVAFTAHDYSFDGPSELTAGWHTITLTNNGAEAHHLQFARLNDGVTPAQLFEALPTEGLGAMLLTTMNGGVGMIPPGATSNVLVDFTRPGTYVLLCFIPNAEGVPHLALGMTDVLKVVGPAADSSAEEPTADLEVRMRDFAFDIPATLPAGAQTWKVINDGPLAHEMIVVKLNDGVSFEQFMAELAENGEAAMPGKPIGGAQALSPNLASFVSYDLAPGEYAVLCFIPDLETGVPHLALGMVAAFTVEVTRRLG